MSISINITTRGFSGAATFLRELGRSTIPNISNKALAKLGSDLVKEMQNRAPVRTGYLRANISVTKQDSKTLQVTSSAPYSGYVNYGTYRMPPRPYFSEPVNRIGRSQFIDTWSRDALSSINTAILKYQNSIP